MSIQAGELDDLDFGDETNFKKGTCGDRDDSRC
jgi:hypothetical protein